MNKKPDGRFVKTLFGAIAPRYDFLNRLLSLRQDVGWRRRMVAALEIPPGGRLLDAACGTGDVIVEAMRQNKAAKIYGIDFAEQMLAIARQKTGRAPGSAPVFLVAANALAPPFTPRSFDAVTIAFGIRNIAGRQEALEHFRDLLKPGGTLAVLELSTPAGGLPGSFYMLYFKKILPAVGGLFSKNFRAYRYLPASVLHFPPPAEFAALMRASGFTEIRWQSLTFGIAVLYTGSRPASRHYPAIPEIASRKTEET